MLSKPIKGQRSHSVVAWMRSHLLLIGVLTVAVSLVCQWTEIDRVPLYVAANVIVTLSLVVVGVVIMPERDKRFLGFVVALDGLLWSFQWLGTWNVGPLPLIAVNCNWILYLIAITGVITYPKDCPLKAREKFVVGFAFVMPMTALTLTAVSMPEWNEFHKDVWWPSIWVNRSAFDAAQTVFYVLQGLLAISFVVVTAIRIRRLKPIDRAIMRPIIFGYSVFGLASALSQTSKLYPGSSMDSYYFVLSILFLLIPAGAVGTYLLRRLQHASIAEQLTKHLAQEPPTIEAVREAMRKTLHDPELDIYYWSPKVNCFVDTSGQAASISDLPIDRIVREVFTRDHKPLAVVFADSSIERHPREFDTALNAGSVALENASLQAIVRSQLEEVKESQTRIVEAAMVERRRIERDFHDGVQQRLLAVLARLGTARRETKDATSAISISSISSDLKSTLNALRDMTNGISPPELRQLGLKATIEVMTEGIPLHVKLNIEDVRYPEIVESTAYFVVCESYANVIKHANATRLSITINKRNGYLEIEVFDNGEGEAQSKWRRIKGPCRSSEFAQRRIWSSVGR